MQNRKRVYKMDNIKELIKEFCDDQDLDYKDDYSGRGMYGKNCIAITCDYPLITLSQLFAYIVDSEEDITGFDVEKALGEPIEDSMGMSSILYFPHIKTA